MTNFIFLGCTHGALVLTFSYAPRASVIGWRSFGGRVLKPRILFAVLFSSLVLTSAALSAFLWSSHSMEGKPFAASLDEGTIALRGSLASDLGEDYDLGSHQTLSRVILLIKEHYVDPDRIQAYEMFLSALDTIQRSVPEVLIDDSDAPNRVKVSVGKATQFFDLGGIEQLWEVTMALREIFRFLQRHLSDADLRRDVEYAAINGMLSTLDPHSVLLKPASFEEVKMSTRGEFGGLGIVISIRNSSLTVISPIVGTPASRAGLKAQDVIAKIGEESTVNMTLEEAVGRLRGRAGSTVEVWIGRKGWTESRKFILTRAVIKIESVTSQDLGDAIGYVRIKSFQGNT